MGCHSSHSYFGDHIGIGTPNQLYGGTVPGKQVGIGI